FFSLLFFFFNDPASTEIYTLSLHDALPITEAAASSRAGHQRKPEKACIAWRSEEHTSELQSRPQIVCRLLLEKKKKRKKKREKKKKKKKKKEKKKKKKKK